MKISELLRVALLAGCSNDEVVFEIDKGDHIDQFDVKAEYNAETHVLIIKEAK